MPGFFLDLIKKALKEDEGPTAEDIDRELTAAVDEIKSQKLDTVTADSVLRASNPGTPGSSDKVYIFDLGPLYALIGGRNGRIAEMLREECLRMFNDKRTGTHDIATLEGNLFLMRFPGTSDPQGFLRAALIVNEIGKSTLGDRFETMAVDGLLCVADVATLTGPDGRFSATAAQATVASGGLPPAMGKPPAKAPQWLQLQWEARAKQGTIILDTPAPEKAKRNTEWVEDTSHKKSAAKQDLHWQPLNEKKSPAEQHNRVDRTPQERRKKIRTVPFVDRRRHIDRRGAGY